MLNAAWVFLKLLSAMLIFIKLEAIAEQCLVEMCTRRYIDLMDELLIQPASSQQYCHILDEYVKCLDEIKLNCRSYLQYHSSTTTSRQNWLQFNCSKFVPFFSQTSENRCFTIQTGKQKACCALYGRGHIRQLDGKIETCYGVGAQSMLDNRFFLVQITLDSTNNLALIKGITIIFRPVNKCNTRLTYVTDLYDSYLPLNFLETTEIHPSITIQNHDNFSVIIKASHLATEIHIIRVKSQLAIIIEAPEKILYSVSFLAEYREVSKQVDFSIHSFFPKFMDHSDSTDKKQMCMDGCFYINHDLEQALTYPEAYGKCYLNKKPHMDKYRAYDKCHIHKVRNNLHATCAFDLIFGTQIDEMDRLKAWHLLINSLHQFRAIKSYPLKLQEEEFKCINKASRLHYVFAVILLSIFVYLWIFTQ